MENLATLVYMHTHTNTQSEIYTISQSSVDLIESDRVGSVRMDLAYMAASFSFDDDDLHVYNPEQPKQCFNKSTNSHVIVV